MIYVTLPDRDELANRLVSVSGVGEIVKRMYPHILKEAGETKSPAGVVMMVALASAEYELATNGGPAMSAVMGTLQHRYVRALIDDPAALEEALQVLAATGFPTGKRESDHG